MGLYKMFNFLKNISPTELTIIIVIFILLFGAKAFISLGKTGGETLREMKKIKKNITQTLEDDSDKEVSK